MKFLDKEGTRFLIDIIDKRFKILERSTPIFTDFDISGDNQLLIHFRDTATTEEWAVLNDFMSALENPRERMNGNYSFILAPGHTKIYPPHIKGITISILDACGAAHAVVGYPNIHIDIGAADYVEGINLVAHLYNYDIDVSWDGSGSLTGGSEYWPLHFIGMVSGGSGVSPAELQTLEDLHAGGIT